MKKLLILCAVCLWALSGCGGGGGGSSSPPPTTLPISNASVAGGWDGTITDGAGETFPVTALISPDNELRMVAWNNYAQYTGTVTVTGDKGTATIRAYMPQGFTLPDNSIVANGTVSFNVVEKAALSGNYSVGGDNGTFTLTYQPEYEHTASLAEVSGLWGYNFPNLGWADFTISETGIISGGYSGGCQYSGSISVINQGWNVYRMSLNVSGCGNQNGTYPGLATKDYEPGGETLWFMLSSPTLSYFDGWLRNGNPPLPVRV